jgi:hypothetical protein
MEYVTGYLAGAMIVNGLFALRIPHEDCRPVYVLALAWPLTLPLVIAALLLNLVDWHIDLTKSDKAIGFRRPKNPEIRGFAVTVLFQEFQFYTKKKA